MADISDLPMLYDIDAAYSLQYVKLARIIRGKIESGEHQSDDVPHADDLAHEYGATIPVTYDALAMVAANLSVKRLESSWLCSVIWQAGA